MEDDDEADTTVLDGIATPFFFPAGPTKVVVRLRLMLAVTSFGHERCHVSFSSNSIIPIHYAFIMLSYAFIMLSLCFFRYKINPLSTVATFWQLFVLSGCIFGLHGPKDFRAKWSQGNRLRRN